MKARKTKQKSKRDYALRTYDSHKTGKYNAWFRKLAFPVLLPIRAFLHHKNLQKTAFANDIPDI